MSKAALKPLDTRSRTIISVSLFVVVFTILITLASIFDFQVSQNSHQKRAQTRRVHLKRPVRFCRRSVGYVAHLHRSWRMHVIALLVLCKVL